MWRERLVSDAVRARLKALAAEDPATRTLAHLVGEPKIFEWALTLGALRDPGLAALVPAVPPEPLRRITADESAELFLWTGLVDVEAALTRLEAARTGGLAGRPRLLDFGCGPGRLLRHLVGVADLLDLVGVDVRAEHVAWCRARLAPLRFAEAGASPPLAEPRASFDGGWSVSVFTHLSPPAATAWRAELARVLRPGAPFVVTLHGGRALERLAEDAGLAARFRLDATTLAEARRSLAAAGSAYVAYPPELVDAAGAGTDYGTAFVDAGRAAAEWEGSGFEIVGHEPAALRGWQDVLVVRRR